MRIQNVYCSKPPPHSFFSNTQNTPPPTNLPTLNHPKIPVDMSGPPHYLTSSLHPGYQQTPQDLSSPVPIQFLIPSIPLPDSPSPPLFPKGWPQEGSDSMHEALSAVTDRSPKHPYTYPFEDSRCMRGLTMNWKGMVGCEIGFDAMPVSGMLMLVQM